MLIDRIFYGVLLILYSCQFVYAACQQGRQHTDKYWLHLNPHKHWFSPRIMSVARERPRIGYFLFAAGGRY